jgi:Lon protease-like protein
MYEIPLFPLNTVLFPGMPLPLHIFEERYKEMVAVCLQEGRPFGVVLIEDGAAERGPLAKPHIVGCTAEIAQVQPLEEGRMLIMTVGRERFRIVRLEYGRPYLVAQVEPVDLVDEDSDTLDAESEQLTPLVAEYLEILARSGNVEYEAEQIPDDPLSLVYLAATLIQLPPEEKQSFLAMNRPTQLMHALQRVYRSELALMRWMPADDIGIFSLN